MQNKCAYSTKTICKVLQTSPPILKKAYEKCHSPKTTFKNPPYCSPENYIVLWEAGIPEFFELPLEAQVVI